MKDLIAPSRGKAEPCRGVPPWAPLSNIEAAWNEGGAPTERRPYRFENTLSRRLLLEADHQESRIRRLRDRLKKWSG